ncbi:MAG: hypothetical protein WKF79_11735 [Nocardioides sp.]
MSERRAWGWVAHLRSGGTTPWAAWSDEGATGGRLLPGAQQLELLRRLNEVAAPTPRLVERVLTASAPGRGTPDLELVGAVSESRFGPRAVDPVRLPDGELVRVAAGLIADDVVAAGLPDRRSATFVRPWRDRYRLVGDPWLADPVRAELVRRGRPPGGRGVVVYVVGADLATMLVDAWSARSLGGGAPPWRDWLDPYARRRHVPQRADLVRAAAPWAERLGPDRVQIVLDRSVLPRFLGVRRPLPARPLLAADAVDLSRRVGGVLGLLVLPDLRAQLLTETLLPRLREAPGSPLGVPAEFAGWVRERAARMRDDLLVAGYAVHGDPDALLPPPGGDQGSDPVDAGVLAIALRLLLDHGQTEEDT